MIHELSRDERRCKLLAEAGVAFADARDGFEVYREPFGVRDAGVIDKLLLDLNDKGDRLARPQVDFAEKIAEEGDGGAFDHRRVAVDDTVVRYVEVRRFADMGFELFGREVQVFELFDGSDADGALFRLAEVAQGIFGRTVALVADGKEHGRRVGREAGEIAERGDVDDAVMLGDDPGDRTGDNGLRHQFVGIGGVIVY